ncbi:MAG TPA: FAD-dependent oxidoreductase, partial [Thermoanaerobaculia bacterium]|nr:FAD-dependent oxidoreductase [Thermoanaerobaculia bacterium]
HDRSNTLSVVRPDVTEAGKGTRIPAGSVLLAVDPATARELISVDGLPPCASNWTAMKPVTLTCLDVALSSLPVPNMTFALGIDTPYYFSVHSKWAQLTPRGGALIHVAKYRRKPAALSDDEIDAAVNAQHSAAGEEYELERLLDNLQPGWREVLVHRRFLTSMTVSNALVEPGLTRPAPTTPVAGLYLAGDWVGSEGILADAALSSARAAAQAILAGS